MTISLEHVTVQDVSRTEVKMALDQMALVERLVIPPDRQAAIFAR